MLNIDRALALLADAEAEAAQIRAALPAGADGQTEAMADRAAECCRVAANLLRTVAAREGRRADSPKENACGG